MYIAVTDEKKTGGKRPKGKAGLSAKVHKIVSRQNSDIESLFCSFCGKERTEVNHLIEGPAVNICDECVAKCNNILNKDS